VLFLPHSVFTISERDLRFRYTTLGAWTTISGCLRADIFYTGVKNFVT